MAKRTPREPTLDELVGLLIGDRKRERREWIWLAHYRDGAKVEDLVSRYGVTQVQIGDGIQAALRARGAQDRMFQRPRAEEVAANIARAGTVPEAESEVA
jgi:hypothetical protein